MAKKNKAITVRVLKPFKDTTIGNQIRKVGERFEVTKERLEQINKHLPKYVEIYSIE